MADNLPLDDLFGPEGGGVAAPEPVAPTPQDPMSARIDGLAQMVSMLVQQQRDAQTFQQGQQTQYQQQAQQAQQAQRAQAGGWRPT